MEFVVNVNEKEMEEANEGNCEMDEKNFEGFKAEIDTSAPFESVKEAVTLFGGIGFWRPHQNKVLEDFEHFEEEINIAKVEEQAIQLEKDLIVKERDTLGVLKELEATKLIVEELKLKLQKETHGPGPGPTSVIGDLSQCPSSSPGLILMELKQAKLNLTQTTTDLAEVRASVETYNEKIEKERISMEKTRKRLALSSSKISSLEEELKQTRLRLRLAQSDEVQDGSDNHEIILRELERFNFEVDQFKKMGDVAKSELVKATSEIEETKCKIKTAEIRLIAAKKMKEAARASEAVALAEIKALSNRDNSSGSSLSKSDDVTLTVEEYSALTCKAREAADLSKKKVIDAMLQVDEANVSKLEILRRVEEATEEIKTSKRALEEALTRVEAANRGKLAVEETLRNWRSENSYKRRSVQNSTKFKNSSTASNRRESRLLDVNGLNLGSEEGSGPVLRPTLSIGQILSRKLLLPEECGSEMRVEKSVKRKVSLGQMLSDKENSEVVVPSPQETEKESGNKQSSGKRKKFGFVRFSRLLTKQSKKKKKTLKLR